MQEKNQDHPLKISINEVWEYKENGKTTKLYTLSRINRVMDTVKVWDGFEEVSAEFRTSRMIDYK